MCPVRGHRRGSRIDVRPPPHESGESSSAVAEAGRRRRRSGASRSGPERRLSQPAGTTATSDMCLRIVLPARERRRVLASSGRGEIIAKRLYREMRVVTHERRDGGCRSVDAGKARYSFLGRRAANLVCRFLLVKKKALRRVDDGVVDVIQDGFLDDFLNTCIGLSSHTLIL